MDVIIDTREKKGFEWNFDFHIPNVNYVYRKLDCGDYSIDGYEDKICIERKRNTGEIANNLGKYKKRFTNEMELMSNIPNSYIICEFTDLQLIDFPVKSGVPKKYWPRLRITGEYMASSLSKFPDLYGVEIIFCECRDVAQQVAATILKDFYEKV